MTKNERKDVYQVAKANGYMPSSTDSSKQVNSYGNSVTHIGSNRTQFGGNTYYGASAAKKAINGK